MNGADVVEGSESGGLEVGAPALAAREKEREDAAVAKIAGLLGSKVQRVAVPKLSRTELVERIAEWVDAAIAVDVNGEGRATMKELVDSYRAWQLRVHGTTKTPPWGERSLRSVVRETLEAAGADYVESGRYFRALVIS